MHMTRKQSVTLKVQHETIDLGKPIAETTAVRKAAGDEAEKMRVRHEERLAQLEAEIKANIAEKERQELEKRRQNEAVSTKATSPEL